MPTGNRRTPSWVCNRTGPVNDPRYTPTTTFETFPFPDGLSPDIPASDYKADPCAEAIASAARRLVELDAAVAAAYGWADGITDDAALRDLLARKAVGNARLGTRHRRVPSAATIGVAGHHRKRFGEPVQTGLAKRGQRRDGGPAMPGHPCIPETERRLIPPAPLSMDTGAGTAVVDQPDYARLLRHLASFDHPALHVR